MSHRWAKFAFVGAAIVLLAAGLIIYSRPGRNEAPAAAAPQPVPVIATTVQQHDVPIVLTGLGTVTALNTATVRSQITGLLISVNFQEGQAVKKGELLAQIDPRTYQAQLDQAEATLSHDQAHLKNAQLNLERYRGLSKQDSIARETLDNQLAAVEELDAQIKNDQAAVESAKTQLSYTSLVAPFDGVTGIRLLDVGNIIHPPTSSPTTQSNTTDPNALVVVTQVQPIGVVFTLSTTSIPEVQNAMANGPLTAIAYSQDSKTQLDTGQLLVVNNQADPGSGTVQLKAIFPNPQRRLWPGTFVNVRLVLSTEQAGLTIPLDAVQLGPQGPIAFVVDQNRKIAIRPISMRQSLNGEALIDKGLSAGETVVVRGQYRLSPGTLVTLADPDDPGAVPNPFYWKFWHAAMNLSAPFIRRPIATALLMVAIVLLGLISYMLLPVAALPNVDFPTIQVTAQLPGADPQTMASSVATPLERQFGQIPGLAQMTSSSALGYTQITLQFTRGRTVDSAAQDVQGAINATAGQLPVNLLNPPIYRKVNPADTPILLIALTSETLPLTKVSDYANSILAQKLSQMPGVGLVSVGGAQNPAIRIQVNPAQLAAAGLDLETVRAALSNSTVNQPKGTLYGGQHAFSLLTNDQLTTADGFNDYILAYRNGAPVRVRDVGRAVVAAEDKTLAGWMGTQRAILIAVQRQPGANVIETVDRIKKELPQLQASLPPSIKVSIVSDRTQTIRASVADVQFTLLLTIALVVSVIFLFLRKLWATVIPAIAVPLSLVGTFAVMYVFGFSLDNLSLMALTIAVGFVVDDAVVMIENIMRHVEDGASPMEAAVKGAGEIGFTILSISISLIAVFIPLFLMSGVVGLLFREFAVTVAVSIVVSLVVSLTLTPMMCARLLTQEGLGNPGSLSRALERFFDWLVGVYDQALLVALRYRLITLMVMIFTICLTGALFMAIPKGFFPQQDTGMIVGISEGAQDISPQAMMERQEAVLSIVIKDPAVASATAYIGPGGPTVTENDGRMFITLKPHGQRSVTADQVIARLSRALQPIQGITLYMQAAQDINVGAQLSKTQYQFTLVDVDSDELNHWAPLLLEKLQQLPSLAGVASDQQSAGRTLKVEVNRDVASRLGVDPATVDSILYDAFGQRHVARIYTTLNEYYVILEVDPGYQLGPNALSRIYAKSAGGGMVPLNQLASVSTSIAPIAVNHQGQFPSVTLSFNLNPKSTIGEAVSAIRQTTASLHLPPSIATSFQGNAQAFQSSLSSTPILILAALIAVYLILGMLYESTIHPLTIISTLPSAGLGALLTLMLFGMPLDVIGIIGIILLIGIVKKNGIMLVDFALVGQQQGLSSENAIHEACRLRFRPILMTTLCALLGGVPLMLGTGTGSEIRQPLGYVIVGGLLVSQLLTLFTTPIVYIYMDSLNGWLGGRRSPSVSTAGKPS